LNQSSYSNQSPQCISQHSSSPPSARPWSRRLLSFAGAITSPVSKSAAKTTANAPVPQLEVPSRCKPWILIGKRVIFVVQDTSSKHCTLSTATSKVSRASLLSARALRTLRRSLMVDFRPWRGFSRHWGEMLRFDEIRLYNRVV